MEPWQRLNYPNKDEYMKAKAWANAQNPPQTEAPPYSEWQKILPPTELGSTVSHLNLIERGQFRLRKQWQNLGYPSEEEYSKAAKWAYEQKPSIQVPDYTKWQSMPENPRRPAPAPNTSAPTGAPPSTPSSNDTIIVTTDGGIQFTIKPDSSSKSSSDKEESSPW
jgi:hypothetical protein